MSKREVQIILLVKVVKAPIYLVSKMLYLVNDAYILIILNCLHYEKNRVLN
jgi:hypothetical protein